MKKRAMIARSGIQYYLDEELPGLQMGEVPREYKGRRVFSVYRPSFVLEEALDKFKGKPVRVEHQWVESLADPAIIGSIDSDAFIKHNKGEVALCATLDIDDKAELPSFKELSPGYVSVNQWRPGSAPNGEPYEILCTKIKDVNHLAIVREARGGSDMKMLDGGRKPMIHSGLIRSIKKKLMGVMDSKPETFEDAVDALKGGLREMEEGEMKAKTASLIDACADLPDSDEKEKLMRYIADIPLLKEEDDAVRDEALSCIKESYKSLDADASAEGAEKTMEEEKKEEPVKDEAQPAPAPAEEKVSEEPKKDEAPAEERKDDGDASAKILDALDALSKKLDSLFPPKEEKKEDGCGAKDEEPEKKEKPAVADSLPRYTQTLASIEKGYSLDDAFAKLKGRR